MADVVVTLTGNEAALYKSIQRIVDQQKKLEEGYGKVKAKSKEASDAAKKGAEETKSAWEKADTLTGGLVSQVGGAVTAWGAITAAASIYKGEVEAIIDRQNASFSLAQQIASRQETAAINLASVSTEEAKALLQQSVPNIARETGFQDLNKLTEAITAVASTGTTDTAVMESAIRAAAQLTRLNPDSLAPLASASINIGQATGLTNAEQNIAMLSSTQALTPIADLGNVAQNLAPTLTSAVATAPQQAPEQASKEAAALFALFAQQTKQTTGESTRTFMETLLPKLSMFFDGKEGAPTTIAGRIEALQQNEDLRAEFLKSGFGEAKFQIPLRELLKEGSATAQQFQSNVGMVRTDEGKFQELADRVVNVTPQTQMAAASAQAGASMQALKLGDVQSQAIAAIRDSVTKVTEMDGSALSANATGFNMMMTDNTDVDAMAQSAVIEMQERIKRIELGRIESAPMGGGFMARPNVRDLTPFETEQIQALQQQIESINQQVQIVRQAEAEAVARQQGPNAEARLPADQAAPNATEPIRPTGSPDQPTPTQIDLTGLQSQINQLTDGLAAANGNLQAAAESANGVATGLTRGSEAAKSVAAVQSARMIGAV
jgi:hypothetical protein